MWSLHSETNPSVVYYLPVGGVYTIGRKDTDIVISGDPSISRKHATITVREEGGTFTELKTKFGSSVNNNKVMGSADIHNNDILRVGQGPTRLRFAKKKMVFCCSNVSPSVKKEVKTLAQQLGGVLVNSWSSSCTHLVMTSVTVTVKVVNALSTGCPIVTPSWLQEGVTCVEGGKLLPAIESYQPSIADSNLCDTTSISLDPSPTRKTLFKDKNIYFLCNKQLSNLRYCITTCGGSTHLLSQTTPTDDYCHDNSLVIDPAGSNQKIEKETVQEQLVDYGLRFITEAELGRAVLLSSTERFCNPSVTIEDVPTDPLPPPSLSQYPSYTQSQSHTPNHTQSTTFINTQCTNDTILAHNTQLSQVGVVNKPAATTGVSKVDETIIIKDEPMDTTKAPPHSNHNVTIPKRVEVKIEKIMSQTTPPSASLQSNATILAADSAPPLATPTNQDTSFSIPGQPVIASAFRGGKKRGRNGRLKLQSSNSSKRVKSEMEEDKGSDVVTIMSDAPPTSPSSPDPVTPLPTSSGFLSARKRTPVKSQTPRHQTTPTRPRPSTPVDDTENPLTDTAADNKLASADNKLVSTEGFLSTRRGRPVVALQSVKLEYQGGDDGSHGNDDVTSYPQPIVESVSLLIKTRRTLHTPAHATAPGVVNYKRFRKAANVGGGCSFDRIIGGSDLSVFAVATET